MEPRIQYAQTKDGVSIAFTTFGEGMPFVYMPWPTFSHIQLEWQRPEWRKLYERLGERRMLIQYDRRGSGLSDRDVGDYSLDAHVLDLEAVVDQLDLERFVLWGQFLLGPAAVVYAVRHPERVSHLFLWCSLARGSQLSPGPQLEATGALINRDWELFTETFAHVVLGWTAGEHARKVAGLIRESVAPEGWNAFLAAVREFDVASLLPRVSSPTLVLDRRQRGGFDMNVARGLASQIPNARLAMLEGTSSAAYLGDTEAVLQAINEFLGGGEESAAKVETPPAGDVHTILFTDIESSTALTERLGDAAAQELRRTHDTIVRNALKAQGGNEIKHTGDGIMASFASASRALECANAVQRAIAAHVEEHADTPLRVRIGLNAGEPIAEERDLFGTAVNLAKRICDQAEPGEILVSDVVRQLAAGKEFLFADRGETALRGFEDPVRLFEVRWREDAR